jgi:GNAT superfamily N-acetyltransferase
MIHRYQIIPASPAHAEALAPRMRAADVAEVYAAARHAPLEALTRSLAISTHAWCGIMDGEVACLFGVGMRSLLGGVGSPWMLGSDLIEQHGKAFLRRSRGVVAQMQAAYPELENWVDARNAVSIRWLRWLGFTLEPAAPFGPFDCPFHRFWKRNVTLNVRACSVAEIETHPSFPSLAREYADDCALHDLPPPTEKFATYRLLEGSGVFTAYGAFWGGDLVGFVAVLAPVIPHYGVAIAVTESLFVAKAHRKTGAGIRLIRTAEAQARHAGSPALLVSAPAGGRLAEVLPGLGYRETNRVFMKSFSQ